MNHPQFLIVDLFCGAGGTTTGFAQAEINGTSVAKIIACVNHDPKAIESHWKNHPEVIHFEEDIRTLQLSPLIDIVRINKRSYPDAKLVLWASLECTNFSKAKGGLPRDADSRTLADHLFRYVQAIDPDYVQIENVVEFMSWGPLDDKGKPVSRKNGSDWMRWRTEMCGHGYYDEWKELNSANFGAYTSRNRLFGCFSKHHLPVVFPEPTHAKKTAKTDMFGAGLQPWKPVKEVLNFDDQGESIFNRSKPLSDKTLERIYAGLVKYVAKGDTAFISKYFSGRPAGKVNSIDDPASTVTTFGGQTLIQTFISNQKGGNPAHKNSDVEKPFGAITTIPSQRLVFLTHYFGNGFNTSGNDPLPTITTKERAALVEPQYLVNYNHSSNVNGTDEPAPTLLTKDKLALVKAEYFIDKHYGNAQNQSIDDPAGTILPTDKHRLVEVSPFIMPTNYNNGPVSLENPCPVLTASKKYHYLVNPSHGGHSTSTEAPCPVIVARQDKAPLYLVQVEEGSVAIAVYPDDSEAAIKIKQFMALFGLVDIKMRMLRVLELLRIQGFPEGYILSGTQADQKKFIGNSVVPHVVKAWCEAMAKRIIEMKKLAA